MAKLKNLSNDMNNGYSNYYASTASEISMRRGVPKMSLNKKVKRNGKGSKGK